MLNGVLSGRRQTALGRFAAPTPQQRAAAGIPGPEEQVPDWRLEIRDAKHCPMPKSYGVDEGGGLEKTSRECQEGRSDYTSVARGMA